MSDMSSSNDFLTESGKEEMKKTGGRRKQCKPVKVSVAENGFSEEDKTCPDGSKVNGNVLSENNSLTNGSKEPHDKDYLAENNMSENCQPIVCPDCGGSVPTMAALDQHVKCAHSPPQDPDSSTCPTPYHQLARDLQKSTASTQLEKIASKIDLDELSSAEKSPKEVVINLRLAAKDLAERPADKKTEPSDKKLQASSASSPNIQLESKPEHLPPPYVDPLAKLNQQQNQSFLDRVVEQELAKHTPLFEMLKNSTKPQTPNGHQHQQQQHQQQSFLSSNDFPPKYSMPVTVDTEDFCHLCQKHFCNKYYLRKHKQDVHGISSDASNSQASSNQTSINGGEVSSLTSDLKTISSSAISLASTPLQKVKSSESLQLPEPFSSMMSSLPFGLPFSGDLSSTFLFPPTSMTSQQSGFFNSASTISNLASLMLLNPFASPLSLMKSPPLLQQSQNSNQTPSSSLNTLIELQNFGLTNGLLGDVASLKNNLLYKFPTADQPAPCDLCQKEFCNTYFLKVHKRDKHGIPLEESSSSIPAKRQANNSKIITSAPLFSLDGIEPGENVLPMGKLRSDDKNPFHFGSKRSEETCFLCKQHFSSRYNLMMHLLSSHNIKPEGFGLASELMQMELLNGSQLPFSKTAGGASNSGKTSERVACNICNKEVCNKYFLKTHKLKVHGIQEGGSESNSAAEHAKGQPAVAPQQSESMDSKNLHLDQLMQKYDEIAKQFTSMPLDLNRKSSDGKTETIKKEIDIQNKPQSAAYNNTHEGSSLHKIVPDKAENSASMFGALDMIAKNKFDYKMNEFQNLTNHYNLFDFPQSFKNLGAQAASGKNKLQNFSKHYFGKEGKLSDDGAAKLGYDPEAYCEICKKEFCSKYFLKTHKQKIHGVRYEGTSDSRSPSLTQTSLSSISIPTSFVPEQNLGGLFSFDGSSSSGSKGKEPLPSNMTRVTCEICGKELCNKYFLRTHMLKIHGISDSIPAPPANKQEITTALRKESPTGENPAGDVLHQQKYRPMQDLKPPFIKSNDSNQTQNLVIGVKELKQVTEMLLQSSESCSSFQQSYDGDVNCRYDRDSVGSGALHDVVQSDSPSKSDRQCVALSSEPKTPPQQQTFPRDANDKSWKEEFLKLQSFMSGHQDTEPLRSELLANRKRRLDSNGEAAESKSSKKHANNSSCFGEKENEKTKAVRLADLQNKYSPHAGIPEFASSQRREEFAKMENNRDETAPIIQANNCILQPFEMQERPNENAFAQCKVFLPVVQPICEPITLKFTVTPVDH